MVLNLLLRSRWAFSPWGAVPPLPAPQSNLPASSELSSFATSIRDVCQHFPAPLSSGLSPPLVYTAYPWTSQMRPQ